MSIRKVLVAGLLALGAAGVAVAEGSHNGEDSHGRHHGHGPMGHASVEMAAMHNIMAELISAKTGKSVAEIKALFEKSGPHDAIESLGLTRDDMRPLFEKAHAQLIDKAAAAGLITADQATTLRAAPLPDHKGPPPAHDDDRE
jgi:hypothetical protein